MVGEGIPVRSSRFSALYRYFRLRRGLSVLYTVLSSFKAKFCHILLRKIINGNNYGNKQWMTT